MSEVAEKIYCCGYDGIIFCRWAADAIGKAISINWEKFV